MWYVQRTATDTSLVVTTPPSISNIEGVGWHKLVHKSVFPAYSLRNPSEPPGEAVTRIWLWERGQKSRRPPSKYPGTTNLVLGKVLLVVHTDVGINAIGTTLEATM